MMEIVLPIIMNLVLLAIVICGVCVGKKNGVRLECLKWILILGDLVGTYFLTPIVKDLLFKIEIVNTYASGVSSQLISSFVFLLVFLIIYVLICLVCLIVKKITLYNKITGINGARRSKIVGMSRKETRELRREYKKTRKELKSKKELRKVSQAFGIVFGILTSFIVCLVVMLPIKYIAKETDKVTEVEIVNNAYEKTPIGQLDKWLEYSDKIVK